MIHTNTEVTVALVVIGFHEGSIRPRTRINTTIVRDRSTGGFSIDYFTKYRFIRCYSHNNISLLYKSYKKCTISYGWLSFNGAQHNLFFFWAFPIHFVNKIGISSTVVHEVDATSRDRYANIVRGT